MVTIGEKDFIITNMFEDINLISCNESNTLFGKQTYLINKYIKTRDDYFLLQLALLQTISPISDYNTARKILMRNIGSDNFDLLVIGAYLSAQDYECCDNCFLSRLLEESYRFNKYQKSVVKYLYALQAYNKQLSSQREILKTLDESINLCCDYTSNYYLRYLIIRNDNDIIDAKKNVIKLISDKDISLLSIDELISPKLFTDEHILMTYMPSSTFESLFV